MEGNGENSLIEDDTYGPLEIEWDYENLPLPDDFE